MRKKDAVLRVDGLATRKALIEVAGELAAERGWQQVFARDVSQRAGVNAACINYWFGSRDGLYNEILRSIPGAFLPDDVIDEELALRDPEGAIRKLVNGLRPVSRGKNDWRLRLWAREIFGSSTPSFISLVRETGVTRFKKVRHIVSLYLGLPDDDIRVECCQLMLFYGICLTEMLSGTVRSTLFPAIWARPEEARAFGIEYVMKSLENFRNSIHDSGGYSEPLSQNPP